MSFSKSKLSSRIYRQLSQERQNGFALKSIECDLLEEFNDESVISDFVSKHVSRATLLSEYFTSCMLSCIVTLDFYDEVIYLSFFEIMFHFRNSHRALDMLSTPLQWSTPYYHARNTYETLI